VPRRLPAEEEEELVLVVVRVRDLRGPVPVVVARELRHSSIIGGIMSADRKETAYPTDLAWVEHSDSRHPDTPAFRDACDICGPESWDGIPEGWLEEDDNDA
jgi:hypothetical protein